MPCPLDHEPSSRAGESDPAQAALQAASHASEMRDIALPPGVEPGSRPSEGQRKVRYRKRGDRRESNPLTTGSRPVLASFEFGLSTQPRT